MKRHALVIVLGLLAASGWGILLVNEGVRSGEFKSYLPLGATVARSVGKLAEEYYVGRQVAHFRYKAKWGNLGPNTPGGNPRRRDAKAYASEVQRLRQRFMRHIKDLAASDPSFVLIAVIGESGNGGKSAILASSDLASFSLPGTPIEHGEVKEYRGGRMRGEPYRLFTCPVDDQFSGKDVPHPEKWVVHVLIKDR